MHQRNSNITARPKRPRTIVVSDENLNQALNYTIGAGTRSGATFIKPKHRSTIAQLSRMVG